ncbi:MAG: FISUMP domain-containing protein [Saprospiraceae bacterium]
MPDRGIGAYQSDATFSATPARGKNYLLVIGIDQYLHFPHLNNAVRDAQTFATLLQERFQFDGQHTETLFNENATERQLLFKLRDMARLVTPEDNLVIYFSGHGEYDAILDEGYWIPVDAGAGAMEDYIPNSKIHKVLGAIKSRHTFLIIDSCFSGSLFMQYRSATGADRLETLPSRWGLTSGRNEVVPDGPVGSHSPFAESLINQLRLSEGDLGVGELCQRVVESVAARSQQIPRGEPLRVEGHEGGQFFFRLKQPHSATDTSSPATPAQPTRGGLLYSIPGLMEVGQESRCEVRIAFDKATLLADFDTSKEHAVRDIRVSNLMEVELMDPALGGATAFAVRTISSVEQFIDPNDYTQWIFYVKALLEGIHPLALKVTVIEVVEGKERRKEIVLEENIEVKNRLAEEPDPGGYKTVYSFDLAEVMPPVPESAEPQPLPPFFPPAPAPSPIPIPSPIVEPARPAAPKSRNKAWIRAAAGVAIMLLAALIVLPDLFLGGNKDVEKIGDNPAMPAPAEEDSVSLETKEDTIGIVPQKKRPVNPGKEMVPEQLSDRTRSGGEAKLLDTYIDQRDGKRYPAVKTGGQTWLQRNLAYQTDGAVCYGDKPLMCENLGALYTWEAAMRACPNGWRLPDTKDWDALANAWGGYDNKKTYEAMIYGGQSFFQTQLSGKQAPDGAFSGMHEEGWFWTSSASGTKEAIAIVFSKAQNPIKKIPADKKTKLSCRCVKN